MSPEERKLIHQFIEASDHTPCMCPVKWCDDCETYEAARIALEEALRVVEGSSVPSEYEKNYKNWLKNGGVC